MILGHVIALNPTVKQAAAMLRAAGVKRFTYNWALAEWKRQHDAGGKPSANKLAKQFNAIKSEQFPWVYESPKNACANAFSDLGTAFQNFFDSLAGRRAGPKVGYPGFKKKGECADSFYVANDRLRFHKDGRRVTLSVIGSVKIHEPLRFVGKIVSGTVRRVADRWYLSVQVEGDFHVPWVHRTAVTGYDLGLKVAVVPSRGKPVDAPKPLRKALKKLRRANKSLHRKKRGSANRRRAQGVLAIVHAMVANVRKDFLHKTTTRIVRETQAAVLEDLNVEGMKKLRSLARAVSDVGMGELRRQVEYKGRIYGCTVHVADRWYPSSKRCHSCANVKDELSLGQRVYECDVCGLVMDRDLNAAWNLEAYPGLPGNGRKAKPVDTTPLLDDQVVRVSSVDETGTRTWALAPTP